jgi:lipoyl(octanoyl) transferase
MELNANKPTVHIDRWGLVDYKIAWDRQTEMHRALVEQKRNGKNTLPNVLVICQHHPVYTLGKSGSTDHLRWDEEERARQGLEFYKINRGGDITYHGPGQLVVYPIFDLSQFFQDVHRYVRSLEEAVIRTLNDFDISGERVKDYTGVWLQGQPKRKVCAIGVHLSRWVSMHGLALNVNPRLAHFDGIVPCGIAEDDKEVTSMSKELGMDIDINKVEERLIAHFEDIFDFEIVANDVESEKS